VDDNAQNRHRRCDLKMRRRAAGIEIASLTSKPFKGNGVAPPPYANSSLLEPNALVACVLDGAVVEAAVHADVNRAPLRQGGPRSILSNDRDSSASLMPLT